MFTNFVDTFKPDLSRGGSVGGLKGWWGGGGLSSVILERAKQSDRAAPTDGCRVSKRAPSGVVAMATVS